jgi:hypothetical protein
MVAGDARNDGQDRIYVTSGNGFGIKEVSYQGTAWAVGYVSESSSPEGITIGRGRNDDVQRLYTAVHQYESRVQEYTFAEGQWALTNNLDTTVAATNVAVGAGRGDGVQRVYVVGGDSHLYEYSWQ